MLGWIQAMKHISLFFPFLCREMYFLCLANILAVVWLAWIIDRRHKPPAACLFVQDFWVRRGKSKKNRRERWNGTESAEGRRRGEWIKRREEKQKVRESNCMGEKRQKRQKERKKEWRKDGQNKTAIHPGSLNSGLGVLTHQTQPLLYSAATCTGPQCDFKMVLVWWSHKRFWGWCGTWPPRHQCHKRKANHVHTRQTRKEKRFQQIKNQTESRN